MHSLNHFLINVDPDETIASAQYGQFGSFVESKFDDNNWHTALALTIKDGKTDISEDEYRGGFDAWVGEENRDSWDFDAAIDAAYKAMYWDINKDLNSITDHAYDFDREFESPKQAAAVIAHTLVNSYTADVEDGQDLDYKGYARPRLAKVYEQLRSSYFNPPFFDAYDFSPYTARTFDLTGGDDEGLAILTVDVHT